MSAKPDEARISIGVTTPARKAADAGGTGRARERRSYGGGLGMRLGRRLPAAPTPIEAGTFEVHASVVVTYEVGQ